MFTSLKFIMTSNMSKIHLIVVIFHQFIAPKGRANEEPKEVLTFNRCQLLIFISVQCLMSFLCPLHEILAI